MPITEGWEPKTSERLRKWYNETRPRPVYFVGQHFQANSIVPRPPSGSQINPQYAHIFSFLDSQRPQSTWLIAFGSVYYPYDQPERLYAVLRTLLRRKVPFVLARSGHLVRKASPLPEDLSKEIESSGLGLIVSYVPQEQVLRHPSMGVFLTHGG